MPAVFGAAEDAFMSRNRKDFARVCVEVFQLHNLISPGVSCADFGSGACPSS